MSNEVLDEERRRFIGASLVGVPGAAFVSAGLLASGESSAQTRSAGPVKQPAVIGYPTASELAEQVRPLRPPAAGGLLPLQSARDDFPASAVAHRRLEGRYALLEQGGHGEGAAAEGTFHRRGRHAHRPV
jgi:hypothetical protein